MARYPNGPEGIITTFKDLGSFIAIYDEIVAGNLGIQTKLTAATQQQDYDYGSVKSLSTFINNMVSASNNLDTAETNLVSSVSSYLTTVAAVDLDSSATTASGVIADLIFAMRGATGDEAGSTVSGILVLTSGHYDTFFVDNYGIRLPHTSGTIVLSSTESMDLISGVAPVPVDGAVPGDARMISDSYAD